MRAIAFPAFFLVVTACGISDPAEEPHMEATIDGVPWKAKYGLFHCNYDSVDGYLNVAGLGPWKGDTSREISLSGKGISGLGTVTLGGDTPVAVLYDVRGVVVESIYQTTESLTGTWTVAVLDLEHHQCRGTFSFVAEAFPILGFPFTPDTIHVTDGSWAAELKPADVGRSDRTAGG